MSEFVYLFRTSETAQRQGHLKNRGLPLDRTGKVVRGGQKTVTDGPYIETKDLVAGFIVVEARDLAEAVALSTGCPMLEGGGSVEVRPVMASLPS